ncbi:MAG: CUB domain-containing protein, partial [Pseudomonadota bacterium]
MCVDSSSTATTGSLADSGGTGSNYGNSETCGFLITATGGGAITLDFSSFDYESSYDFLQIYDGSNTSGTLLANYTGSGSAPDVVATSGSMYIVHDTDNIITRSGFIATWSIGTAGSSSDARMCVDSSSTAATGSLADSGGTGGNYGNNETCSFLITATGGGAITLDFSSFDYESSYDFLRIYDGSNTSGTLLANFTGTGSAPDVVATSGSMYIVHDTDFSVTRSGFSATWSVASTGGGSEERLCVDSSVSAETGIVTDSGGTAGNYQNNESCGLLIQPSSGGPVTLSFASFNYESSYDFLRVYDGTSASGTLLGTFSGTSVPADVTANSGSMFLLSTSDSSVTRPGFEANWSTGAASGCPALSLVDTFDSVSYAGSNGTATWAGDWIEIGETDGPSAGIARVNSSLCSAGNCLRIGEPGSASSWTNRGVYREADLSGAQSATLSFNYFTGVNTGTQSVVLAVSDDGGSSWTTLQTYNISTSNFSANPESFDVSGFATGDFQLRFLSSGNSATIGMYVDDLRIDYQPTCTPEPVAEWHFDEGSWTGSSGEAVDQRGSNDGTAVGGASTTGDGQICRAAQLDGVDDRVRVTGLQNLLGITSSLSYWINTTQTGNATRWLAPGMTGLEVAGGLDDVFWGWIDNLGQVGVAAGDLTSATSNVAINDGNWHHVVMTRDASDGALKTYV